MLYLILVMCMHTFNWFSSAEMFWSQLYCVFSLLIFVPIFPSRHSFLSLACRQQFCNNGFANTTIKNNGFENTTKKQWICKHSRNKHSENQKTTQTIYLTNIPKRKTQPKWTFWKQKHNPNNLFTNTSKVNPCVSTRPDQLCSTPDHSVLDGVSTHSITHTIYFLG